MEESSAIRAIMIGAGLLIALITISAVITYYNTAVDVVRKIGPGANLAERYRQDIESSLLKDGENSSLTGTEVKNVLNYFYKKAKVSITFTNLPVLDNNASSFNNMKFKEKKIDIVDESTYNTANRNILPVQKYRLVREMADYSMKLTFTLI